MNYWMDVCCRKICFLFLPSNTFHKIYYYSLFEIPKSCKTRLLLVVFKWAKKFNNGIYHFGEKNFGNLATMTWHWGIQPEWRKPHCVDENSLLDKMSNGATNSPNFKTVRHNFQKVTGQFFGNLQFRWR